jgi:hypothetical protein
VSLAVASKRQRQLAFESGERCRTREALVKNVQLLREAHQLVCENRGPRSAENPPVEMVILTASQLSS